MNRAFILPILLVFSAIAYLAAADDSVQDQDLGDRKSTRLLIDMDNVTFQAMEQTTLIFSFDPRDSIKIKCPDCVEYMGAVGDGQKLDISLRSGKELPIRIGSRNLDSWVPIRTASGKFGLVFSRENSGGRPIEVKNIEIWRKSPDPIEYPPGVQVNILDVRRAYVPQVVSDEIPKLDFAFRLKRKDKIRCIMETSTGSLASNLIGAWFNEEEDFDVQPVPNNQWFTIPAENEYTARYAFRFFNKKEDKESDNLYHLKIDRIPAPDERVKEDTGEVIVEDTVGEIVEEIIPLRPVFKCSTLEENLAYRLPGELNLTSKRKSKHCMPITLYAECYEDPADCEDCQNFWAYWVGAGEDAINAFLGKDSIRKAFQAEGLIYAYAYAERFKEVPGLDVFPVPGTGEDVWYGVLGTGSKNNFLDGEPFTDLFGKKYDLNKEALARSTDFITSDAGHLNYNPEDSVFLCLCNNNDISAVPVLFRYQQFLMKPDSVESPPML